MIMGGLYYCVYFLYCEIAYIFCVIQKANPGWRAHQQAVITVCEAVGV